MTAQQITKSDQPKFAKIKDLIAPVVERIRMLHDLGCPTVAGISTGFDDLDEITSGMQPGDLIILAGRPSVGKSSLALNIALNISLHNLRHVALINTETGDDEPVRRLLSSLGDVSQSKLRSGLLEPDDWAKLDKAANQLAHRQIHIHSTRLPTIELIQELLRKHSLESAQLGLLIVDNLTALLSHPTEFGVSELTEVVTFLKELAVQHRVPLLLIVGTNRNLEEREDKRPVLGDLPHCRILEASADIILFIYRDEIYEENSPYKGTAEIFVTKHRNGAAAVTRLVFQSEYARFQTLDRSSFLMEE